MPILRLHQVEKSFAGAQALKPLCLELEAGEVLGLVGENGAGKSTLLKLLSGVHTPDGGEIWFLGERRVLQSPRAAQALGIAALHQELAYCAHLSVAENLLLGEVWPRRPWGAVDWPRLHRQAASRLAACGCSIPPGALFASLRAVERQEVAIARALSRRARLLILDEPTAALPEAESGRLLAHVRRLKAASTAVIYVSHRLEEVLSLADRVAVLRDGELVAVHAAAGVGARQIVRDMLGRDAARPQPAARTGRGDVALALHDLRCPGLREGVSLRVHSGEVLGLAGLEGSGCRELLRALFGLLPILGGRIELLGRDYLPADPAAARRAGLAYVPEERKRQALVAEHSVAESIAIGFAHRLARGGWLRPRTEQEHVRRALSDLCIRASSPSQPAGSLSGGNQQKAVLGRALAMNPSVLILNEPTRGVDLGARAEIHRHIDEIARAGRCILLATSDLPELVDLSHRVCVFRHGALACELAGPSLTEENVRLSLSGLAAVPPAEAHPA